MWVQWISSNAAMARSTPGCQAIGDRSTVEGRAGLGGRNEKDPRLFHASTPISSCRPERASGPAVRLWLDGALRQYSLARTDWTPSA